jgi:hypothetical protein
MVISDPRTPVKNTKINNFCIKDGILIFLKDPLHKFQEYFTKFSF